MYRVTTNRGIYPNITSIIRRRVARVSKHIRRRTIRHNSGLNRLSLKRKLKNLSQTTKIRTTLNTRNTNGSTNKINRLFLTMNSTIKTTITNRFVTINLVRLRVTTLQTTNTGCFLRVTRTSSVSVIASSAKTVSDDALNETVYSVSPKTEQSHLGHTVAISPLLAEVILLPRVQQAQGRALILFSAPSEQVHYNEI